MKKSWMKVIVVLLIIVVTLVLIGMVLKVLFPPTKFGPAYYPEDWQEQREIQIRENLNQENKKLYLLLTRITLLTKEDYVFDFGIKNTKQELLKYKVIFESVGSNLIFGSDISDNILYELKIQELQPTEIEIIPIKITAEEVSGTGLFKLSIVDVTNGEPGNLYASENFLVTVKD